MVSSSHPGAKVGARLVPHAVEYMRDTSPDGTFVIYHEETESDYTRGWVEMTFSQLCQTVDWTAWWLHNKIGSSDSCETIAFMASNDVRYSIFSLAAQKAGFATLLPSPRLQQNDISYLVQKTKCKDFFHSFEQRSKVESLEKTLHDVQFWEVPSLSDMLNGTSEKYEFFKTFEEAIHEPLVIIHSSGSTGFPNLIPLSNGYMSVQDSYSKFAATSDGRKPLYSDPGPDERVFSMTPMYHLMAYWQFHEAIFRGVPAILAPEAPLTPELLNTIHDVAKPTFVAFPPSMLEELSRTSEGIRAITRFRTLLVGGGPLSPAVGDRISKVTRLCTSYGTSEIGVPPRLPPQENEDWNYLEFHPDYGIEFEPVNDDEFEAVIYRRPENLAAVFYSFPDLEVYRTRDLFIRHRHRKNSWLYRGRKDEVVVLSNGEKFNPILLEQVVAEHQAIDRTLVIGQGRFQSLLIVQPIWASHDFRSNTELLEEIWSTVEQANELVPKHARVAKSHIIFASRSKPFQTTPKGTVKRKEVEKDYAFEIDAAYSSSDSYTSIVFPENPDLDCIKEAVLNSVSRLMPGDNISATTDLYANGLDSLQNLQLVQELRAAIKPFGEALAAEITPAALYKFSSIAKISQFLASLMTRTNTEAIEHATDSDDVIRKSIDDLVQKYTKDLPKERKDFPVRSTRLTVVLTGSTGYIGTYILHQLLKDTTIQSIYCLNRSDYALTRAVQSFGERGLDLPESAWSKVIFWRASFGEPRFGLMDEQYETLKTVADVFIHNAWKVDFNHKLESFEGTHIRGIHRLTHFALGSPNFPHLCFISSQSTVGNWPTSRGSSIPEQPYTDPTIAARSGYGLSKHAAERILYETSQQTGLPTTIIRIGQIGGPMVGTGAWPASDWVPSVIYTSKAIAQVPLQLSYLPIDWIPVDSLALIISELVGARIGSETETRCEVYHLANPNETHWTSLLPAIHRQFAAKSVPFQDWVDRLKSIPISEASIADKPALKLLDYLQNMVARQDYKPPVLETVRAQLSSHTLRQLPPVDESLMELYLRQWNL